MQRKDDMEIPQSPDSSGTLQGPIRVVMADDHPVVRAGIVQHLARQLDIVVLDVAEHGDAALQLAATRHPDVLVLDLAMPGLPAVEVVRQVRALPAPPRVLMLSAYDDVEQVLALLAAGATGYLLKDERLAAITAAVRAVARGERRLSAAVAASVVDHQMCSAVKAALPKPSARELDVLRLVATQGWTNARIARELGISERTVRFHLENLFGRLEVDNRMAAVIKAQHQGWLAGSQ